MATTKDRINITLPSDVKKALMRSAHRHQVPQATQATRLLEMALELEEDELWDKKAEERDTKDAQFVSHKSAWN